MATHGGAMPTAGRVASLADCPRASSPRTVKLWDNRSHACIHTFYDHTSRVASVAFHPDGTCVASGSADRSLKLWDIRTLQLLQHYPAHADTVNKVAFHPSGSFLLSASADSTLKVPKTAPRDGTDVHECTRSQQHLRPSRLLVVARPACTRLCCIAQVAHLRST